MVSAGVTDRLWDVVVFMRMMEEWWSHQLGHDVIPIANRHAVGVGARVRKENTHDNR